MRLHETFVILARAKITGNDSICIARVISNFENDLKVSQIFMIYSFAASFPDRFQLSIWSWLIDSCIIFVSVYLRILRPHVLLFNAIAKATMLTRFVRNQLADQDPRTTILPYGIDIKVQYKRAWSLSRSSKNKIISDLLKGQNRNLECQSISDRF